MTGTRFCPVDKCTARGYHKQPATCGDACKGCRPRPADDGLVLCVFHTRHIAEDAIGAAALYDELALVLTGRGGQNSRVSGTTSTEPVFNHGAASARADIHDALAGWTRVIVDERGVTTPPLGPSIHQPDKHCLTCYPPPDKRGRPRPPAVLCPVHMQPRTLVALGEFLAVHNRWLAAQAFADEVSTDLAGVLADGIAAAYPSGTRVFDVCPCPTLDGGTLRAILRPADHLLPKVLQCSANEAHAWQSERWRGEFGRYWRSVGIVDTASLAVWMNVTAARIRQLVGNGTIAPLMRWGAGRRGQPTMWFRVADVEKQLAQTNNQAA